VTRLKLDQYVDIAIRSEVVAKNRSEQRKPANMVASAKLREPVAIAYNVAPLHCSALFPGTMIPTCRDLNIFNCLLYYTGDEGLHRHVLQRGLHPELAVNIVGQINMNFSPVDTRFSGSTHDLLYFCTDRSLSQA
jgi:hypothetical protein